MSIKIVGQNYTTPLTFRGTCQTCGLIVECEEDDLLPDAHGNKVTAFCHVRCQRCEQAKPRTFWEKLSGSHRNLIHMHE